MGSKSSILFPLLVGDAVEEIIFFSFFSEIYVCICSDLCAKFGDFLGIGQETKLRLKFNP